MTMQNHNLQIMTQKEISGKTFPSWFRNAAEICKGVLERVKVLQTASI